ncbi:enhanced serine sensitivity protein SseB [Winogradskya consettensis]|uniref:Enhanced serine sensitivity protein SseB n=1 Tax=Winogradskya consettensis TaxID=113560 RepID=A0A919VNW8_9ACTN|nr:enhanced serine sensitivity protein SseB [Actinoplanes consettensis]GIM70315.1 enhanced serine sensitivity protein SseB [Actinoplanes consettensis]
MPFPANPLESVLAGARSGAATPDQLLHALRDNQLWVPLPGGADAQGNTQLPVLVIEESPYVAAYTSAEQLTRAAADTAHMVLTGRELAALMAPQLGLAVNPGGEIGLPIHPGGVDVLRGESRQVPAGRRMRLGDPVEEPTELLAAVAASFSAIPAVTEARRALAQVGEEPPALLIGIRTQDESVARTVAEAVRTATQRSPVPYPVDTVVLRDENDPLTAWMLANTTPFYTA